MNRTTPVALLALAVTACSGGGGGEAPAPASAASVDQGIITMPSDQRAPAPRSEPVPITLDGIWSGSISDRIRSDYSYTDTLCHIEGERLDCLLMKDGAIIGAARGEASLEGGEPYLVADIVSSERSTLETMRALIEDGEHSHSIYAHLDEKNKRLNLSRSKPPNQSQVGGPADGVYLEARIDGKSSSLVVDSSGDLFAQSSSGCVYSGQLDGNELSLTIDLCGELNGEYNGLALLTVPAFVSLDVPFSWEPQTMLGFAVWNETQVITGYGLKDSTTQGLPSFGDNE